MAVGQDFSECGESREGLSSFGDQARSLGSPQFRRHDMGFDEEEAGEEDIFGMEL